MMHHITEREIRSRSHWLLSASSFSLDRSYTMIGAIGMYCTHQYVSRPVTDLSRRNTEKWDALTSEQKQQYVRDNSVMNNKR